MKKYTHAWLAFMAVKRLDQTELSAADRPGADNLVKWFGNHRDGVIRGAWYPDEMIKDMAKSHILKIAPAEKIESKNEFKTLPATYLIPRYAVKSPLREKSFVVKGKTNLPDRCESIAHSVVDHLKTRETEEKGSSVSPSDNQIALILFMLSHYVADAHVPFHCDARGLSKLHDYLEDRWDNAIVKHYLIDEKDERFLYDLDGYPARNLSAEEDYESSFLRTLDDSLTSRKFSKNFGSKNDNVWDFMSAICQHSYLMSYCMIPQDSDYKKVTPQELENLKSPSLDEVSVAALADAIDSISRVWLRVWQRYLKWELDKSKSEGESNSKSKNKRESPA